MSSQTSAKSTSTFDPTRPVQTRDGRKARIVCTDVVSEYYPILVLVTDPETDREVENTYTEQGKLHYSVPGTKVETAGSDLINIPEKPKARHHAEIVALYYSDDSLVAECKHDNCWHKLKHPSFYKDSDYRLCRNDEVIFVSPAEEG